MNNPNNLGNQKSLIDLLYLLQLYNTLINYIHQAIIYIPRLPILLFSKLGFYIFFMLFYSFVIIDSKNIYFYYVCNLLKMFFYFGIATPK